MWVMLSRQGGDDEQVLALPADQAERVRGVSLLFLMACQPSVYHGSSIISRMGNSLLFLMACQPLPEPGVFRWLDAADALGLDSLGPSQAKKDREPGGDLAGYHRPSLNPEGDGQQQTIAPEDPAKADDRQGAQEEEQEPGMLVFQEEAEEAEHAPAEKKYTEDVADGVDAVV